ncbi:MAG: hydrolase [Nannocystis sp.]|nr:hydrolase [Nannocystis sp.]
MNLLSATIPLQFGDGVPVEIDGLTPCTLASTEPGELDPGAPIVVLVHGCNDSAGRFTTLAEVFEAHDQQTVCFTYESRDTIDIGARRLARALAALEERAPGQPISVIGHSQGGLVSRRALTTALDGEPELQADYELVTVSSPFAGIHAARHCGLRWLHGLSLGITPAICRGVAGRNWVEIHSRAAPVQDPGALRDEVRDYLQIRTDERGSCRRHRRDGGCAEDDYVFSLEEQRNPKSLTTAARGREVEAGHVGIVGDAGDMPTQLIELLQSEGIMNPTPPAQREAVARLLRRLYLEDRAPLPGSELASTAP